MTIIIRRPWTRQPQWPAKAKKGGGLNAGLIFLSDRIVWTSMFLRNSAERLTSAVNAYADTTWQSTERINTRWGNLCGIGTNWTNTGFALPIAQLNTAIASTGQATLACIVRTVAAQDNTNAGGPFLFGNIGESEYYGYSDSKIYLGPFSGTRWVEAVTPPTPKDVPHMFAATHRSGKQAAYYNNALIASASISETPTCGIAEIARGLASGSVKGFVYWFALWNRVLSENELSAIYFNPWQLYADRQIINPTAAAGYTHPTLSNARMGSLTSTTGVPLVDYAF